MFGHHRERELKEALDIILNRLDELEEETYSQTRTALPHSGIPYGVYSGRYREMPTVLGKVDALLKYLNLDVEALKEECTSARTVVKPKSAVGRPKGSKNKKGAKNASTR